jgi:hypothetical protein
MTQISSTEPDQIVSNAERRHRMAALLLEKWMLEEDGYDERVWPILEQELKDSALRCRDAHELGA